MRYKFLKILLVLCTVSTLFAEKAILGPDLNRITSRELLLNQPTHIQVLPSEHLPLSDTSWETVALGREQIDPNASSERFTGRLEYTNYPDGPYGGFIFEETDTALVWFRPGAECTLNSLDIRFNVDGELSGETIMVQIYSIKEVWVDSLGGNGTYDFSKADYVTGDNGPHDQLLAEIPITVDEVGLNVAYEIDLHDWGGIIDMGCNDFAIVIGLPVGNGGGADFYYSQFWDDRGKHHGFKYYHNAAGWKSRFNFLFLATIDYWLGPPPFFTNETDHPDVYYSDNPGPYLLEAEIPPYGVTSCTWDGSLSQVHLKYSVNNGPEQFIDASDQIISGENVTNHFQVELDGFTVGDIIDYEWWAADTSGDVTHEISSPLPFSFAIRAADRYTQILLVDDNTKSWGADYWAPILDAGGWVYDYWDVASSGILTAGILDNYTTLLWVQGNNVGGILVEEEIDTDLIAPFLDGGGNFMLSSSEYMGAVDNRWPEDWISPLHPFLRDYLHVSSYLLDANIGVESEVSDDTLYTGVSGSLVSGDFANTSFVVQPRLLGVNNWADEALPDETAEIPFMVYSNYLEEDWIGAGTLYNGAYKTIFLPWQFEAIVDDDIRFDLMTNIMNFFGSGCPSFPVRYGGGDRYAQAADAGDIKIYGFAYTYGEIENVGVEFTLDRGNTWSSVPMIDGEATIPALSVGDTCSFMVTATDECGLSGYSIVYKVWKLDFTPSADILYVGDDYYTWYYEGNYDSTNFARTRDIVEAAGLTIDYYDLDSLTLMDTRSILNQYSGVIWNAYADWDAAYMPISTFDNPLSEYEGTLLYSSEEMIGTWFDWPIYQDFDRGHFMYDVLGVNWAANDFAPDSIIVKLQTDLGAGIPDFTLDTAQFYFGNLADIIDPIGAPGPYTRNPPFSGWLSDSTSSHTVSAATPSTTFLSFSMMMMPDAIYERFINNWLNIVSVKPPTTLPTQLTLAQNYPNPFNPTTNITFDVPEYEQVILSIYNVLGQKVIDLVDGDYSPGTYDIQWSGIDQQGKPVSSGLYIYRLTAGGNYINKKMVFLK